MILQKSYIDSNGKLAIPIKIRKLLKLKAGDEVELKYSDSELVVSTFHKNIEKARSIIAKYENINLQETLKNLRQQDASKE